jgi:hypothetical protein
MSVDVVFWIIYVKSYVMRLSVRVCRTIVSSNNMVILSKPHILGYTCMFHLDANYMAYM